MRRRRRINYRRLYPLFSGLFIAVIVFTFLAGHNPIATEAANLSKFDPGYIISNYTMGNYNSMTEQEIQEFLTRKNPCSNTDYKSYQSLTAAYPNITWHWKDDHFVCLSEELFGDGMVIGEGETAAHIIYQAAQDYKINPQVILVLLQKESSLITDSYPNSLDYRAATGYGCPDTAPCDSKYYGLKNQIRKAAALFREVLDGGWSNYHVGNNYVKYNPNAACGGTVVDIKNLATASLYRYTPYQPNAAAINANYGYGDACSAYGNRNFYLYFYDWFGDPTIEKVVLGDYKDMVIPRVFFVKKGSRYVDYETRTIEKRQKSSFEFFTYLNNSQDGSLCLSIGENKNCYLYSDLEELESSQVTPMSVSRMLIASSGAKIINYEENTISDFKEEKIVFSHKIQINDQLCLIEIDSEKPECVPYEFLSELPENSFSSMNVPRRMYSGKSAKAINVKTGITTEKEMQEKEHYSSLSHWFGSLCLQPDSLKEENECILYAELKELNDVKIEKMAVPRFFKLNNVAVYDAEIGEKITAADNSGILFFEEKTDTKDGLCLRAASSNNKECYLYSDIEEINNFTSMAIPRKLTILSDAQFYDLEKEAYSSEKLTTEEEFFTDKITLEDGSLCLRSLKDHTNKQYRCIKYESLSEN